MTFLLSFVRSDVALLASDQRTTIRQAPDAPAESFSDTGVKIATWGKGWIASGPSVRWREAILAGNSPAEEMRQLEAEDPAHAQVVRERQVTFIVEPGARRALTWEGAARFPDAAPSDVLALCPNGSDPVTLQAFLNAYHTEIRGAPPPVLLKATARLYAAVYDHCGPQGTVSPLATIALVWPDGRRELHGSGAELFDDGKYAITAGDLAGKEIDADLYVKAANTMKVGTVASPTSLTKTLRVGFGELLPEADTTKWRGATGYMRPNDLNPQNWFASVVLPKGVTITSVACRAYRGTTAGAVSATLWRNDDSGVSTSVASVSYTAGTGWQTLSASASQLVGNESYVLVLSMDADAVGDDVRFTYYEITYTMPSYDKGY